LTLVRSSQFFEARVGSGQPFMVWEISPDNVKFSIFFHFGIKKISSGLVKKYPMVKGGSASYLLRGQKYGRVGSGPISTVDRGYQQDN